MILPLAIDIETVANDRAGAYSDQETFEAPANYKDPAKIEQAVLVKRSQALAKAGLRWWTGKVVEICAIDVTGQRPTAHYSGEDEGILLQAFANDLGTIYRNHYLTSKSGLDFDFPFLVGRYMAHDIGVPTHLQGGAGHPIQDINKIFGWGTSSTQRGKLSDYAWGLGLPPKTMAGSGVQDLYNMIRLSDEDGADVLWQQLKAYCEQDTWLVAEILKRYLKTFYVADAEIPYVSKDFTT